MVEYPVRNLHFKEDVLGTLQMVYDLELLARVALVGEEEPSWRRAAYYSGLVTGLKLVRRFLSKNVVFIGANTYSNLVGTHHPVMDVKDLCTDIYAHTSPRVSVDLTMFQNPGLRHGDPGSYYKHGMKDAFEVAWEQLPTVFEIVSVTPQRDQLEWIDRKIKWADALMQRELSRLK